MATTLKNMENQEKFECADCGCVYWVDDRDSFECPNCESAGQRLRLMPCGNPYAIITPASYVVLKV